MLNPALVPAWLAQRHVMFRITPPLLIILVCLPLLLMSLSGYPAPWFDEGFKMNSARLMSEEGIFGLRTAAGISPFDVSITSGPLEVGAMALSFKLFGLGVLQARLVIVAFTLVAALLIYRLGYELRGRAGGLLITLMVLATPPINDMSLLLIGRQVLAETPALVMTLLGLWLWMQSWEKGCLRRAALAGVACGIGLISKPQFGFALLPALTLIGGLRWLRRDESLLRAVVPPATMLAVFGFWIGLSLISPEAARYNQAMLQSGTTSNLITGLWGSTLTKGALLIALLGTSGGLYGVWRFWAAWRAGRITGAEWLMAALALIALINTFWFALLSVGWPRYAYIGYIAGLILLGLLFWDLGQMGARLIRRRAPALAGLIYPVALGALILVAFLGHFSPALAVGPERPAAAMAAYIERNLPRTALIETWEWELDALGAHTNYHHPHQRYVYEATYQQSRQLPFDLSYDILQAAPDYLLTGPFSSYTGLYSPELIAAYFTLETEIGPYRLYRRER